MEASVLKIGECWLDVGRHGVVRDGELLHVEPRDFSVLLQLIENAPNIVTSQALLSGAWRQKIVGDNALHQAIGRLRKALGDEARNPRYIRTQSKIGYQFIAPVTPMSSDRDPTSDIGPVAVLPFRDYSDEANPYFVDGLCLELCNLLLRAGVQVISMDRAARVQRRGFTDLEVGGRVGARSVLSGTVMVLGEEMRVTSHLGDVESERQLWSEKYDVQVGQLFQVQTLIAEGIVKNMLMHTKSRAVHVNPQVSVVPLRAADRQFLADDGA